MGPIPNPVRQRIIKLYDQGKRTDQIAAALGYCQSAIRRVRQHFQERGTSEHQMFRCGAKSGLTPQLEARLRELIHKTPDATLVELGRALGEPGKPIPFSTINLWLGKLKITFKKSRSRPANKRVRM